MFSVFIPIPFSDAESDGMGVRDSGSEGDDLGRRSLQVEDGIQRGLSHIAAQMPL